MLQSLKEKNLLEAQPNQQPRLAYAADQPTHDLTMQFQVSKA